VRDSVFYRVRDLPAALTAIIGIVARGGIRCAVALLGIPLLFVCGVAASRSMPAVEPLPYYWLTLRDAGDPFCDVRAGRRHPGAFAAMFGRRQEASGGPELGVNVPAPLSRSCCSS